MPTGRDRIGSEARAFARFLWGLPRFLRHRMSYDEARRIIQQRLRERDANFLASIDRGVFGNPRSPYRTMLDLAGNFGRFGSGTLNTFSLLAQVANNQLQLPLLSCHLL